MLLVQGFKLGLHYTSILSLIDGAPCHFQPLDGSMGKHKNSCFALFSNYKIVDNCHFFYAGFELSKNHSVWRYERFTSLMVKGGLD